MVGLRLKKFILLYGKERKKKEEENDDKDFLGRVVVVVVVQVHVVMQNERGEDDHFSLSEEAQKEHYAVCVLRRPRCGCLYTRT